MTTYTFKLSADEQHTGPNPPAGLVSGSVKVTFAITEENFGECAEATILIFVNLSKSS